MTVTFTLCPSIICSPPGLRCQFPPLSGLEHWGECAYAWASPGSDPCLDPCLCKIQQKKNYTKTFLGLLWKDPRAGKRTQSVKSLLLKHEDLNSEPQHTSKKSDPEACICKTYATEAEAGGSLVQARQSRRIREFRVSH